MAKRTPPLTPQPANLSAEQMRAAIPKLARRIEELKAVDVNTIQHRSEPRFSALEQKIDDTLVDVFGADTLEYKRYQHINLDTASINYLHETSLHEVHEGYERGMERAVSVLQTIVDLFEEKLQNSGESPRGRAVRAFADLDLHPEIDRATSMLFRDGHYANAVEDACKVLDALVKSNRPVCTH
jgi:hypothetical protein